MKAIPHNNHVHQHFWNISYMKLSLIMVILLLVLLELWSESLYLFIIRFKSFYKHLVEGFMIFTTYTQMNFNDQPFFIFVIQPLFRNIVAIWIQGNAYTTYQASMLKKYHLTLFTRECKAQIININFVCVIDHFQENLVQYNILHMYSID